MLYGKAPFEIDMKKDKFAGASICCNTTYHQIDFPPSVSGKAIALMRWMLSIEPSIRPNA